MNRFKEVRKEAATDLLYLVESVMRIIAYPFSLVKTVLMLGVLGVGFINSVFNGVADACENLTKGG